MLFCLFPKKEMLIGNMEKGLETGGGLKKHQKGKGV